jgi:NADH-quinone oxidoreductase subunit E
MPHLILELALWVLLTFFTGCVAGYVLRALIAGRPVPVAASVTSGARDEAEMRDELAPSVDAPPLADGMAEDPLAARAERPKGIAQARGGKSDNLQRISGIGPKNERTLHSLGFFHFDQIAGWSDEEVAWVDNHLKFNGRIIREEWILQAGLLAEGKEDEFERLYGTRRSKHDPATPN